MVVAGLAVVDFVLTGGGAVFGLLLPAAVGVFRGIRTFLADYDFTVSQSPDGLRIEKGLLDTRIQTLPWGRLQAVRVTRPLLWRPFGWVRVDVTVAGYGRVRDDDEVRATSTLLPVAPAAEAQALVRRVLPELELETVSLAGAPRRARWLWPLGWSGLGVGSTQTAVVAREGLMGREVAAMPFSKPQSVRLTQGPLQRRLRLATVHSDTTPGPVRVRALGRDEQDARGLFEIVVRQLRDRLPQRQLLPVGAPVPRLARQVVEPVATGVVRQPDEAGTAARRDEPAVVGEVDGQPPLVQ